MTQVITVANQFSSPFLLLIVSHKLVAKCVNPKNISRKLILITCTANRLNKDKLRNAFALQVLKKLFFTSELRIEIDLNNSPIVQKITRKNSSMSPSANDAKKNA